MFTIRMYATVVTLLVTGFAWSVSDSVWLLVTLALLAGSLVGPHVLATVTSACAVGTAVLALGSLVSQDMLVGSAAAWLGWASLAGAAVTLAVTVSQLSDLGFPRGSGQP